jgi:transcriptional regulator with XRE-family HTH domain
MPPARRFDGRRLKAARLAAGYRTQALFAQALSVSKSTIANWEGGRIVPDPERFPSIADAVGRDIGVLFPRHRAPDLADLRCDAGYAQYEVERIVRSKDSVGDAERGVRRLTPVLLEELATLYGVSQEVLSAAQDRNFVENAPTTDTETPFPSTLSTKIEYLLTHLYPGDKRPPSNDEIAYKANSAVGTALSGADIQDLRTGTVTETSPVIAQGLAEAFGVTVFFFEPDQRQVVRTIAEGLRTLEHARNGDLLGIATRGLAEGKELSPEMLAFINDIVDELPD